MHAGVQSGKAVEVFYSYAHEDEALRDKLISHLASLRHDGLIQEWYDRKITPGQNWAGEIDQHLNSADLILLLVSADFINSSYSYEIEVKQAMERHNAKEACVIPIILRPCDWTETPFGKLQALPKDAKPITECLNHDTAFKEISLNLREVIKTNFPLAPDKPIVIPPRSKSKYSNPKFPTGYFSKIDTIHLHVDGGTENDLVLGIVDELNRKQMPSKLTAIHQAIEGPQRKQFRDTYQVHTPGVDGQEELEYFSTTLLHSNSATISGNPNLLDKKLKPLLAELSDTKGIVIEIERVVGKIGEEIEWTKTSVPSYKLNLTNVGFHQRRGTLPVEIHYAIDIQKEEDWQTRQPFSLQNLLDECTKLDIHVGGWFLFDKDQAWAYRSNSFVSANISSEEIKKQRDTLAQWLANLNTEHNFEYQINVLVEQALGVWKTPLERTYPFKTLKELAAWEMENSNLKKFWVVAPNFLGDKNQEVHDAMISNLRKGVEYTYFLRSFADFQRLRKFTKSLEGDLPPQVNISKQINAVLFELSAESRNEFTGECFIANPHLEESDGYKLMRYPGTGEVSEGIKMELTEIKSIVNLLQPSIEKFQVKQWSRISIQPEEAQKYHILICTDLENCTEGGEPFSLNKWEKMLQEYDLIVAEEVSKCGGIVVKNISNGYLIIFEEANSAWVSALYCAERLQKAVQKYNNTKASSDGCLSLSQKIALHCGSVSPVIRAYGNDFIGRHLNRCKELLRQTEFKKIYMTEQFCQEYIEKVSDSSDNSVTENIKNIICIADGSHHEFKWYNYRTLSQ